jgi:hypothetical protein
VTRFSGHESFACRYAWLPKAYRELATDPDALADEDRAMVRLGVGKNMVRSIRFWVEVMGVAEPTSGRSFDLTQFCLPGSFYCSTGRSASLHGVSLLLRCVVRRSGWALPTPTSRWEST